MPESWMLSRLNRETKQYHPAADSDRLAMLGTADQARYLAFLSRVHGFEAPVETGLVATPGLEQWIDVRGRDQLRLLQADLRALGVTDASSLPRCRTVAPFREAPEALGWLYVIERNTLLHGLIERQLRARMPDVMKSAGAYLAGQARSNGLRLRDLGNAIDRMAKDVGIAERIVGAAKLAFRVQHGWYETAVPPRQRRFAS